MENKFISDDRTINNVFDNIKNLIITSKNRVYSVVNTEMLNLY